MAKTKPQSFRNLKCGKISYEKANESQYKPNWIIKRRRYGLEPHTNEFHPLLTNFSRHLFPFCFALNLKFVFLTFNWLLYSSFAFTESFYRQYVLINSTISSIEMKKKLFSLHENCAKNKNFHTHAKKSVEE